MTATTNPDASIAYRLSLCLPRLPLTNPDTRLADLALDSMDTVELLCVIDGEFGVRLGESDFQPTQTIGGLVAAIAAKTTNRAQS